MTEHTIPTEFSGAEAPAEGEATDLAAGEETGAISPAGMSALVRRFTDAVRDVFTVRTVYGEPIEAHGVTVIPVAQTYFGFGAGGGVGRNPQQGGTNEGLGGGGGGGGVVRPIGFIEITPAGARWVPMTRPWQRVTMGIVPPLLALIVGRATTRRGLKALPPPKEQ